MKQVAVIVVNWNNKADTLACIRSLKHLKTNSCQTAIIAVDNASSDGSAQAIKTTFPQTQLITNKENLGFSGGNNVGIRRALAGGADFIWFLNNDTTVGKDTLMQLVQAFDDEAVGVAGSKIYFSPGREFYSSRYKKSELGKVIWYAGGLIDWNYMYASHRGVDEVDHGQYDTQEETPFVTGCSMMVKREVFEVIGLFEDKFFAYLEDLDFCLRAGAAGYKLLYVPTSVVWHKNAGSSAVGSSLHQYYMTRNRLFVGMRYAPFRTKVALLREGLGYIIYGPEVRRKAIVDGLTGKFGKRS